MCLLQLTARAYHRVLKLIRTIADLVGSEEDPQGAFGGGAAVQTQDRDLLILTVH